MSRRRIMTNQRTLWKTAAAAALSITLSVFAQNGASEDTTTDNSWVGTITTEPTAVRCGANESYYPLKFLSVGDVVRVVGKRQEWYQIVTGGKSFAGVVGYIKYPEKSASVFMVEGSIGTSMGEIEVIAKNIESNEMYRSWRPVYRLHAGDTVEIMSTEKMGAGTLHREAYIVHTVKLPTSAMAWIRISNIERATNPTLGEGGEDNFLGYETIAYSEADASENSGLPVNEVEELRSTILGKYRKCD